LTIEKLRNSNYEMDSKIDNLTEDKMTLLDNLRDKENEIRVLKDDLKTMTLKIQGLTQQLSY
jgi:predicted nuclease with TOPRIM domain